MKLFSSLLKNVVYPTLSKIGYLHRYARRAELSVVTYHGVLPEGYEVTDIQLDGVWVTRDAFRRQLRLLRSRHNVVPPSLVRLWLQGKGQLPERAVLLTCDDGLANAVTDMLPILQEENLTCLFFVTSRSLRESPSMLWYEELYLTLQEAPEGNLEGAFCGVQVNVHLNRSVSQRTSYWHNLVQTLSKCDAQARFGFAAAIREKLGLAADWAQKRAEHHSSRFRMLTVSEIRSLLSSGMEIGSHTASHPNLSRLPAQSSWKEIAESRHELEKAMGREIWSIAYPFGGPDAVSSRELEMAERAGYDCAFVNFGGPSAKALPRFAIPRIHISLDTTLPEFEAHVSGLHQQLRQRFGRVEQIPAA